MEHGRGMGCESCHATHSAAGQQRILYYPEEENVCYLCHDGSSPAKNIKQQFQKFSTHRVEMENRRPRPGGAPPTRSRPPRFRHVECVDCPTNPHAAKQRYPQTAPYASGRLAMVSGLDANRTR